TCVVRRVSTGRCFQFFPSCISSCSLGGFLYSLRGFQFFPSCISTMMMRSLEDAAAYLSILSQLL
ncbi:MAG: hypothetical protein N3E41_08935, partial [Thermofilaceae archaeon]|nr:hypothetical protein [Thermofilaceae archaeon]